MIAHYIESVLMEMADYGLDLHSGGSSLDYLPSAVATPGIGVDDRRMKELMRVFGAPYGFLFPGGHSIGAPIEGAARRNVVQFSTEMGGSGTVSPRGVGICRNGVLRVLYDVGVLPDAMVPPADPPTRMLHAPDFDYYVYALDEGLFEPAAALGDEVRKGDLAGHVHFPETPWQAPSEVRFSAGGLVVCKRIPGRVERGDCLFHLGIDVVD